MKMLLTALQFLVLCLPLLAQEAKPRTKANQANSDDMWVASSVPELPSGVTHHTFRSDSMKRDVGYCLYLPPSYEQDKGQRYPVIYHLHGAGGNETRSVYSASVLDEGIRAGKLPEIILVFPNGGRSTMYQDSGDGRFMAETMMIKELIPHIDTTYHTIAERRARCIEGFSMGGRGSTQGQKRPSGTRAVACEPRQPADRHGDCKPCLGMAFRRRHCEDPE